MNDPRVSESPEMYSNDPNMYAAYQSYVPMQQQTSDHVPAKKQKLSSDSEAESDGESTDRETPSPNENQPTGSAQFVSSYTLWLSGMWIVVNPYSSIVLY